MVRPGVQASSRQGRVFAWLFLLGETDLRGRTFTRNKKVTNQYKKSALFLCQ
jgi:hypothetical protein